MKKYKIYLISILTACTMAMSVGAILPPPPGPGSPTVDAADDAIFFVNSATAQIQNVTAQMSAYIQNINQQAKALMSKYVGKFTGFMGGIFKKKEKQPLPGNKEIEKSKIADIYDPIAVQEALYKMFFQYPVDCDDMSSVDNSGICNEYKKIAKEFYEDTVIEIYTSARELEKQLPSLEQSINSIEEAILSGKSGAESNDDENGVWKNAYNTYETMNSILKIMEEIVAMRAQYVAAQAIGEQAVRPAKPEPSNKKGAFNLFMDEPVKTASVMLKNADTIRFAAISDDDDEDEPVYKSRSNFATPQDSGLSNPYAENAADMASMEKIAEAQKYLSEALKVHNQISVLPGMRSAYDGYNKMVKLHQKSIESVKQADQCAIKYYSYMYENPQKMWNGGLTESKVLDYDSRKGISGWAFKAYQLAKAEDTGMTLDADDFAETNIDVSQTDGSDLSTMDSMASDITKESGGFKDAAQTNKVNQSLKDSQRLPWNIGSEAAKLLSDDQMAHGKNGQWGTAKNLYPMWNDTKSYYWQYLMGKYDAILKRLTAVNTNMLAIDIASSLNSRSVEIEAERALNVRKLSSLRSAIQNEKTEAVNDIDRLVAEKKSKMDAAYQKKENQLAAIRQQREKTIQRLNTIQAQLDKYNIRLQDANEERRAAEEKVSTAEEKIKQLQKREIEDQSLEFIEKNKREYEKDINKSISDQYSFNDNRAIYFGRSTIVSAQLSKRTDDSLSSMKEVQEKDIRTYVEEEETIKEVEFDKSQDLIIAELILAENREKVLELSAEINTIKADINRLTEEQLKLKGELDKTYPAQEKEVNDVYVSEANSITLEYDQKIMAAEDKYLEELEKINKIDLAAYFTKNIGGSSSLPDILRQSVSLVDDAHGTAKELVSEAKSKLKNMGDSLYAESNHGNIISVHKWLMDNLKKLPADRIREFSSFLHTHNYSEIINLLSSIYQSYLANDACIHDYCLEPDDEYYISNNGKRRDFKAPTSVPIYSMPAVREVVFFDFADYENIPRKSDGTITREGILQNLTYIPEIWKKILTSPAYVEKDIDLSEVIKPSVQRLANAGLYPCWQGKDLVTTDGTKYVVYFDKSGDLNESVKYKELLNRGYQNCQNLSIEHTGVFASIRVKVENKAEEVSGSAESKSYSDFSPAEKNSELGYLFDYKNGLRYNSLAKDVFDTLLSISKSGGGNGSQKEVLYNQINFNKNQVGAFVEAVDLEQNLKQNELELYVEIETAKNSLVELLTDIGFTPSSDFDVSKTSDYNLAHETLLRYRNQQISKASSTVSSIQGTQNPVLAERMVKINNQINAMKKDKDAQVILSETSADNAELDENLKSEKANREVIERQKQQSDKDFEKQLNEIGNVYCGELVDNM